MYRHWLLFHIQLFLTLSTNNGVRVHYVHWNSTNPLFGGQGNRIIDIKGNPNSAWDYEQANIICPLYRRNEVRRYSSDQDIEEYVVYNVTKDEYLGCKIDFAKKPRIVALCNTPFRANFFTLTFRPFSPTPGAFEFHPGQQYYFISTSYHNDRQETSSRSCSLPNMRLIFRIRDINEPLEEEEELKNDFVERNDRGTVPQELPVMAANSAVLKKSKNSFSISLVLLLWWLLS